MASSTVGEDATLDALHFASIDYLRQPGQEIQLATHDERMIGLARRMRIPLQRLDA